MKCKGTYSHFYCAQHSFYISFYLYFLKKGKKMLRNNLGQQMKRSKSIKPLFHTVPTKVYAVAEAISWRGTAFVHRKSSHPMTLYARHLLYMKAFCNCQKLFSYTFLQYLFEKKDNIRQSWMLSRRPTSHIILTAPWCSTKTPSAARTFFICWYNYTALFLFCQDFNKSFLPEFMYFFSNKKWL